ncbi:MAG: hypothetical protein IJA82_02830 [Clostridia bacterium]|nr:hypothetical protein [Clostridia bacterium]
MSTDKPIQSARTWLVLMSVDELKIAIYHCPRCNKDFTHLQEDKPPAYCPHCFRLNERNSK